jgi:hypothetical protein
MMMDISFEEIVKAVQKLNPQQKAALMVSLQATPMTSLTREQAIAELEALRAAGAFDHVESLRGKYVRPGLDISDEELNSYLRTV